MKKILFAVAAGLLALAPITAAMAEEHATEMAAPAAEAKEVTLADGVTKFSVEGDMVYSVAADGTKTPAADGDYKLTDGTSLTVKEGKLVPAAAVPATEGSAE